MKISIGADHGGYSIRQHLVATLATSEHTLIDRGAYSLDSSDDYPDFAQAVSKDISSGQADIGVLICTTGIGMSISANKLPRARAALVHSEEEVKVARQHNDANILVLSAKKQTPEAAAALLQTFINTPFEGGRHARRIDKINKQGVMM